MGLIIIIRLIFSCMAGRVPCWAFKINYPCITLRMLDASIPRKKQKLGEIEKCPLEPLKDKQVLWTQSVPGAVLGCGGRAVNKTVISGGIPGWLSGLVPAFGPGHDPGVPGSSPTSGSLHRACFSLCLCLCLSLSLSLSWTNK